MSNMGFVYEPPNTSSQFIVDFVQDSNMDEACPNAKSKSCAHFHGKEARNVCLFLIKLIYSGKLFKIGYYIKCFLTAMSIALTIRKRLSSSRFTIEIVPKEYISRLVSLQEPEDISVKDLDRIVCISAQFLRQCLISPLHWVRIQKTVDDDCGFICMIIADDPDPGIRDGHHKSIKMTPTAEFNLKKSLRLSSNSSESLSYQVYPLLCNPYNYNLQIHSFKSTPATTVRLSNLQSVFDISENYDELVKFHFKTQKYISVGDIISVPTNSFAQNVESATNCVYFMVDDVECGTARKKSHAGIFTASSDESSVYLTGKTVNSYKPKICYQGIQSIAPYLPAKLVPLPLEKHHDELYKSLQSLFTMRNVSGDLWPSVLLYGSTGSGKFTICKAVAMKLGLNFLVINAVNLIGDTSAYTEAKLKALHQKIKSVVPCLTVIKNIHFLGKDKEGQEDKRTILAFSDMLMDIKEGMLTSQLQKKEDNELLAAFIVGISNDVGKISSSLSSCFLYKLKTSPVIEVSQIASTIQWLLNKGDVHVSENVDLEKWSKDNCQMSKFSLGDWKAILSIATRNAYEESATKMSERNHHALPMRLDYKSITLTQENLLFALGVVNKVMKDTVENVQIPNVSWDDIGGLDDIKTELINSIQLPLRFPHLFASGLKRSGTLIFGPPGTGKTLIAKAVASEFKLNFLSVKGPELLNMYVGQSEQNVREVFERARNCAPCVVFFDELDSLAPNRGRSGDSGGVMDRVVSQILAELDGTHSTPNVFIIGATNRPDLIDPALLRPGRFDKLLYVGISNDPKKKENILLALTRKFQMSSDVDLSIVANDTPDGMTGADFYSLCSDAYITAVSRYIDRFDRGDCDNVDSTVEVSMTDFKKALTRVTVSLSENEQRKYRELRSLVR